LSDRHSGLEPLLSATRIEVRDGGIPVRCLAPGTLSIRAGLTSSRAGLLALRYGLELSWLCGLPGLSAAAAALLAAHAAGCFAAILPAEAACADQADGLPTVFAHLASAQIDPSSLGPATLSLAATHPGEAALTEQDRLAVHALWPLVAPTECLLASGGDDRLALDARGRNKYGCAPWPLPAVINLASCTASSLSQGAFAAAERARQSLARASLASAASAALADASDAIADDLLRYFQAQDLAEAVLAASGTDAALVITGLLAAEHPDHALTSILMSPAETGSGVPDAVQGRHFAAFTPTGSRVGKGQQIDGLTSGPGLMTVRLRNPDGLPRPAKQVEAACEEAIRQGVARGRVVLHAIDGSKTGLTAPNRAACCRLARKFGDRLDVVIDACQSRIEPELARWYLRQGFPLLVTGSKFFAAPGFCGAVLFPKARLARIALHGRLPAGLEPYARLQGGFGSRRCPGLVLRWRAALHEMSAFAALPSADIRHRLADIGKTMRSQLAGEHHLRLMPAPRPAGMGWSDQPSVFTFAVRGRQGWMDQPSLRLLYRAMAMTGADHLPAPADRCLADLSCQIGQPVELGTAALGGLRMAVSAAQIVSGRDLRPDISAVLDKLRLVLRQQPQLPPPQAAIAQAGPQASPTARLTG
jgi:hypothetical protein